MKEAAILAVTLGGLLLSACSGTADGSAAETPATAQSSESTSASASASASPSPTATPAPEPPDEPAFRASPEGKRAFVSYIVEGWSHALRTNDASVLLEASGTKPCRGCDSLRRELQQRDKEGWYVDFPGVDVRRISFRPSGAAEVATAVVDIPASQSLFNDGTFRNDNQERRGRKFVVGMRADGQGERRHWTLLTFSLT